MKQTPKYALIEQDFIKKIQSGELEAGAELPSESDLIQLYQVSRVTVRRAIDELYHQGYILESALTKKLRFSIFKRLILCFI